MTTKTSKKTESTKTETVKKGWRIKEYYVDLKKYEATKDELAKAANQVKIMMAHFADKYHTVESAAQGRVMCTSAIENAGLKTVIEPNVLFAYYRKTMENYGLTLKQ